MALGLGVIALVVIGALIRSALAIGAAYALTTLADLPTVVDVLVWLAAGGFTLLQFLAGVVALASMAKVGGAIQRGGLRR